MPVGQLAAGGQEFVRRNHAAHVADDRLDDHGGDFGPCWRKAASNPAESL